MSKEVLLGLFKFGKRDHIEEFCQLGHIYMNPLSYFMALESAHDPRSDKREGVASSYQANKVKLSIEKEGKLLQIPHLLGQVEFSMEEDKQINVFCMYALRPKHVPKMIDPRNFAFGDTDAVLLNPDEFFRRLREAAEKEGQRLRYGLVQYVDRGTYNGPMGIFRKFENFEYQSEFRIAMLPGTGRPYSLYLGDLSDITAAGNLGVINQHLKVVEV